MVPLPTGGDAGKNNPIGLPLFCLVIILDILNRDSIFRLTPQIDPSRRLKLFEKIILTLTAVMPIRGTHASRLRLTRGLWRGGSLL